MPNLLRLLSTFALRCKYWALGPFATPQRRFRLAVSTGFLVAAVGFLVVGAETRSGVAQGIWGLLGLPADGLERPTASSAEPLAGEPARKHRRHAHTSRRAHTDVRYGSDTPVALGRTSVCVRLCDGFAFPVGHYYGEGDRVAHEATCKSECPGARTALYVLPAGSDSLAEATQARTGQIYSKMPDAFRYTAFVDGACTCHPQAAHRMPSLLRDFTLRRGDAVMTPKGLQVFHGGAGFPFKRRDFVALRKSRDVRQADRGPLQAIERASLSAPTTMVASAPPKPAPAMMSRDATRGLEHQARN